MNLGERGMSAYPRVLLSEQVVKRFTQEVKKHPRIEVGGKYVGFIDGDAKYATLKMRKAALENITFRVTDYLDAGPNAERSEGFHLGDARHQTDAFRRLERRYPDIEHLGSWHSHHPNGLARLSSGDIRGYMETVNHPDHHHDYFLVSLGVDDKGFATAQHYLFIRGDDGYYTLPTEAIEIRPNLGPPEQAKTEQPGPQLGQTGPMTGQPSGHQGTGPQQAKPADVRAEHAQTGPVAEPPGDVQIPGWTDTPEGRQTLSAQRKLIKTYAYRGLRLHVTDGRLLVKGALKTGAGPVTVKLLYPSRPGGPDGMLKLVGVEAPGVELTVSGGPCTGLECLEPIFADFAKLVGTVQGTEQRRRGVIGRLRGATKMHLRGH